MDGFAKSVTNMIPCWVKRAIGGCGAWGKYEQIQTHQGTAPIRCATLNPSAMLTTCIPFTHYGNTPLLVAETY